MLKKIVAVTLILALIFPVVALAKGKPADTPGRPQNAGKSGENKVVKSSDEPGEVGEPGEHGKKSGLAKGKPAKPGEKGRMNAINKILAKWSRMPESALKGLWNAILNIGKKIGFVPQKPTR